MCAIQPSPFGGVTIELAILPIDGYHAAGTDPDGAAKVTLDFIARQSRSTIPKLLER
jgi:hypothetical protein